MFVYYHYSLKTDSIPISRKKPELTRHSLNSNCMLINVAVVQLCSTNRLLRQSFWLVKHQWETAKVSHMQLKFIDMDAKTTFSKLDLIIKIIRALQETCLPSSQMIVCHVSFPHCVSVSGMQMYIFCLCDRQKSNPGRYLDKRLCVYYIKSNLCPVISQYLQ